MARPFGAIRKLPSGRYQARYRDPAGVRRSAPRTFTTKAAADAWLAEVQTDIERGRWKAPEQIAAEAAAADAAAAAAVTVRDIADAWLATIPSDNHRVMSASRVRRFINPELGDIPARDLTRERCDAWVRDMEGWLCPAPTERRRAFAALQALLAHAVHHGVIDVSPLRLSKGQMNDTPAREPQTASVVEVEQLAAAMPAALAMAVLLAAWCGLRMGEVLGLQVGDVTEDRTVTGAATGVVRLQLRRHVVAGRGTGGMTIVEGTKANDKPESVVVPPHLVPALYAHIEVQARKADPAWLFPGTRTLDMPCGPATLDRHWRRAREACGLEHLTFHDLRRTAVTLAAQAGATTAELKQRLRHRSSHAAERYVVAARGADVALARAISEQATGEGQTPADAIAAIVEQVRDDDDAEAAAQLADQLEELAAELRGAGGGAVGG